MQTDIALGKLAFIFSLKGFTLIYADKVINYEYGRANLRCGNLYHRLDVLKNLGQVEGISLELYPVRFMGVVVLTFDNYTVELIIDCVANQLVRVKLSNTDSDYAIECDMERLAIIYHHDGFSFANYKVTYIDLIEELTTNYNHINLPV